MYQDFFGFREMPFNITPNPAFPVSEPYPPGSTAASTVWD